MSRNFRELLEDRWALGNFVCVGLDSEFEKIPVAAHQRPILGDVRLANRFADFNRAIVEATKDFACAYKPNVAFYEAKGTEGLAALQWTIDDIHTIAPDVPVILDAKRADIGNTNSGYVQFAFNHMKADAITVHPYLGQEALQPFLDCKDKGIFVLCRTSNPGAGEFQDLKILSEPEERNGTHIFAPAGHTLSDYEQMGYTTKHLYRVVAEEVASQWNENGNCALVVGATYPEELSEIRQLVGDLPILIPGIGAQGGDLEKTVKAGMDSRGQGMIINSSRGIIFASSGSDFADAARRETEKLHSLINQYREEA